MTVFRGFLRLRGKSKPSERHLSTPLPGNRRSQDFRPDIEGLRAIAVVTVLLYHAGLPFVRGGYIGVDVFFVISGFLITKLLVDELERTGTISIRRFYERRIRRLLPMAALVLAITAVLSWWLMSPVRSSGALTDIIAAAVYAANWQLAAQSIDYFTAGLSGSPVMHFWSLAVEEQFYLIWPTLLLAVTWWWRRAGKGMRPAMVTALVVITIASFTYSVYLMEQAPRTAYFSTFTRVWELALGAVLALAPAFVSRMPRVLAVAAVWGGLGAIGWATVRFDDNTLFPGVAALVPTLGAAAIIAAGSVLPVTAPGRLLGSAPMRYVGRVSYALYLWHWPVLVAAIALWGRLTAFEGLVVVAVSAVPAVLTHHWIEEPLRRTRTFTAHPGRAIKLGGVCTASVVALGLVLYAAVPAVPTMPPHRVAGYTALHEGSSVQESAGGVRPNPMKVEKTRSRLRKDGCFLSPSAVRSPACVYGVPSAGTTVVLFGDSHAMHWFPALRVLANEQGWRLVVLTKSGCPAADVHVYTQRVQREYAKCDAWRTHSLQRIEQEDPAMIMVGGLTTYKLVRGGRLLGTDTRTAAMEEGYAAMLRKLHSTGAHTVVFRDNPKPSVNVPECVSRSLDRLRDCATPGAEALSYPPALSDAASRVEGVDLVDPVPVLCRDGVCPAVIGNALVYYNDSHLTAVYVRTLAPWLGSQLPEEVVAPPS